MNIYCINNRTTKVFGMPLHNALVTLCKYDNGANGAVYYTYNVYTNVLHIADKYGNDIMSCMFNSNNDFMDYCYKHDKNNAEYLNYISNNPKQQTFFM